MTVPREETSTEEDARLRHNFLERVKGKRAADDEKYGVPAMDKVKAALTPKEHADETTS